MGSEAPQSVEIRASTLEEAIEKGLLQLGLARNEVIIEIVDEGSRGVLGMGARDAVIRLTPLRTPKAVAAPSQPAPPPPAVLREEAPAAPRTEGDEEARVAKEVLAELLAQMKIKATIRAERAQAASPDEDPPWVLNIQGADLGVLIGRRGETLNALQYITRLIVSREIQRRANIVVDVEGYKARREEALRRLAVRMAEQARRLGKTIVLEPMPANERRIIHLALRDDQSVTTESIGSGDQRKVTIIPAQNSGR